MNSQRPPLTALGIAGLLAAASCLCVDIDDVGFQCPPEMVGCLACDADGGCLAFDPDAGDAGDGGADAGCDGGLTNCSGACLPGPCCSQTAECGGSKCTDAGFCCSPELIGAFCAHSWDGGCAAVSGLDNCGDQRTGVVCAAPCPCQQTCPAGGGQCVNIQPAVGVGGACGCSAVCLNAGLSRQCGGSYYNAGLCCISNGYDTTQGNFVSYVCDQTCCGGCRAPNGYCESLQSGYCGPFGGGNEAYCP